MSSMTAQIAVGMPDLYHDGIRPTHLLWLRENDVPGLTLIEVNHDVYLGPDELRRKDVEWVIRPIRWLGSRPDQILRDAILMLALHVFQTEDVVLETEELAPELIRSEWLEVYKTDPEALEELHELCTAFQLAGKLVVTVLGGSSLEGLLPQLADYSIQVEVCTVSYSHTWGGFGGPTREESAPVGSLTASWSSHGPTPSRYRDVNFPTNLPGNLQEREEDLDGS